ncbi:glutamate ABC transporter substrate-binding protein [Saccharothrix longispora]|uniref:glutamate ABC transporter substrate-binding protein n=1 Tax=Saccharothrix longispora TaxID=33920 RepID=UPI0028FDBA7F|nr:glutamate ABC transporter substrate-binding protein [Saccharothrix longispora]MBY8850855.1 glutamate ABC transporter substrate-binding protein [Saccharothrix sp. MB29]MDU0291136.1 glutamate ABC transporter substrate-binding protein [Saccharothrix longispora]
MRVRTLAVVLLAGGLALTACGKEGGPGDSGAAPTQQAAADVKVDGSATFEKMKNRGKVVVGVKEDQPGLGYKDPTSGKYTGFDVEIAKLVAAKLGFSDDKIEYKAIASAGREQALINGDVDYYVGTYTINAKRKEQVAFAGPYFTAGQDLLVAKDDNSITGPETLKGKKVCSVTGSTPIQKVKNEGLTEPENIVELQNYSQCVTQLQQGAVDAVTTDDAILKGYAAQEPDKMKVVGKPFSNEPYGIGLPKDDKPLRDKINDILDEAIKGGDWDKVYDATLGKSGSKAEKPVLDRY